MAKSFQLSLKVIKQAIRFPIISAWQNLGISKNNILLNLRIWKYNKVANLVSLCTKELLLITQQSTNFISNILNIIFASKCELQLVACVTQHLCIILPSNVSFLKRTLTNQHVCNNYIYIYIYIYIFEAFELTKRERRRTYISTIQYKFYKSQYLTIVFSFLWIMIYLSKIQVDLILHVDYW